MCYITLVKPEAKRENQKQTLNKLHNLQINYLLILKLFLIVIMLSA